ncbi:WD40 repeat domain-containing protein [Deinococcus roseus]|uniref:WD40 repeat domain-containing protein n=1 Tax=Deinococcus roseus TaxID=392414 RepID=UPI00166E4C4C|nr:WD40 repeat domain-containing protein [Deinococcus roseus]
MTPHGEVLFAQGCHLHVFDVSTEQLKHSITTKTGFIQGFAVTLDRLALVTASGAVEVWDPQTGRQIQTLPVQASRVSCRPQGDLLFLKTGPATLAVWDFQNLKPLREVQSRLSEVNLLETSLDGLQIALGGEGIEVLDLPACTSRFVLNVEWEVQHMHFQPEGVGYVDAAGWENEELVRLVSSVDGTPHYSFSHHRDDFSSLQPYAFVDSELLVTSPARGELQLHHPQQVDTEPETWEIGSWQISLLKFQQGLLLVGDVTGQVQLFDVSKKQRIQSFRAFDSRVLQVDYSADGSRLLALGYGDQVDVWEAKAGEVLFQHTFDRPTCLASLGPDGSVLAALWVNENELFLEVLNASTGEVIYQNEEKATALAFAEHPAALFGFGRHVTCWHLPDFDSTDVLEPARVRKGQVISQENTFFVEGDLGSSAGDISPDGRLLVMGRSTQNGRGVVLLWDLHQQREIFRIHLDDGVRKLQWNPSTEQVVMHLHNKMACLWTLHGQQQRELPFLVEAITMHQTGKWLAVSTERCEVHLLDVATLAVLQTLDGFSSPVQQLAFDRSGRHLVTSSGTVDQQSSFNIYGQSQ